MQGTWSIGGINANIVHGWRQLAREGIAAIDVLRREFVPVAVAPAPAVEPLDMRVGTEAALAKVVGKFVWPRDITGTLTLPHAQLDAFVLGLLPHRWRTTAPI